MKHIKEYTEFVNELKKFTVKGTPFNVYHGGKEIEGDLKWVIDAEDSEALDDFLQDEDQLWQSKAEAMDAVKDWWKSNKRVYERSGELYSPRRKKLQQFEPIDDNELEKEFFELIQIAYRAVGGHKKIQKPSDVFADPEWDYWEGVDLHDDRDFDVIMFGKRTKYGIKFSGVGHDGEKDSKRTYLDARGKDLKELGKYIEVSDKIAEILMNKYGVPAVENQEEVEKVLGKKVKWEGKHPTDKNATGNGWYTRKLGGKMHSKILLGRPRV